MKRRVMSCFLLMCSMLTFAEGFGWTFNSSYTTIGGHFYFLDPENKVAQFYTYGTQLSDSLKVPESVEYNQVVYEVVSIRGESYGSYGSAVKFVSIPNTVREIGNKAFYSFSSVAEFVLPEQLEIIGNSAFYNCSALTNLVLPPLVREIGDYCFDSSGLSELTIDAGIQKIGSNILTSCNNLRQVVLKASTPPALAGNLGKDYIRLVLPEGSIHAYRTADSRWNRNILIDGEGSSVFVELTSPGTLSMEIVKQVDYLQEVNKLAISGPMNDEDLMQIKRNMPNLIELDMSEALVQSLPNDWLQSCWNLERIELPGNIKQLGNNCFYDCGHLQEVVFPPSLRTIGSSCFYKCRQLIAANLNEGITSIGDNVFDECTGLKEVYLPSTLKEVPRYAFSETNSLKDVRFSEGLTTISNYAFYQSGLKEVVFPSSLVTIQSYAFYKCNSLSKVSLNEGLASIQASAFADCNALSEITLPSTLQYCYEKPFSSCDSLKRITALSAVPADIAGQCPLYGVSFNDVTLFVPEISLANYKSTDGWNSFYTIEPLPGYKPQSYTTHMEFLLSIDTDERETDYRPDIRLKSNENNSKFGVITTEGNGALALNAYNGYYDYNGIYQNNYNIHQYATSLINNIPMSADKVETELLIRTDKWTFISFPYDVRVGDIRPLQNGSTDFVIRKYSGENRALGDLNYTWLDMTPDSVLHAYEGYIINARCYDTQGYRVNSCGFSIPAAQTPNKNNIFAKENAVVKLKEFASEFAQNRSWNLVGNPYPCYFDTRFMNFVAPITVWNVYSQKYEAYSPLDDNYVLVPGEAFFVQRPDDLSAITFDIQGRQTNDVPQTIDEDSLMASAYVGTAGGSTTSLRQVYNIYIKGMDSSDRTRIVLNDAAKSGYEMNRDAAKFVSTNGCQIHSVANGVRYAINERPMIKESIQLEAYFAEDGIYTLSLDGKHDTQMILIDMVTGERTTLTDNVNYEFAASKGYSRRFSVQFGDDGTTNIDSVDENKEQNADIYTISGMKVGAPTGKGIYIKDGKKIVK